MTQAVFTSDQSRTHLNFDASVDTGFGVNDAFETNALLSSVNARVNADAQCEYTFKQIVRISFR